MAGTHVETILAGDAIPASLREAVRRTGAWASFRPLSQALRSGVSASADVLVVVVPDHIGELRAQLQALLGQLADEPRAVLLLKAGGGLLPRFSHPPTVPVTFGCRLDADELAARLSAMLDMRRSLKSLRRDLATRRRRSERTSRRYERQLRLARQIQRELVPQTLPQLERVEFSVFFRPTEYVSGDTYDVHRLDEHHVAIAVADGSGHGIPAALLTVFIRRALRGKEILGDSYRLLPPDEVLRRLNEELLETGLSGSRFVAAVYAVLDTRNLVLEVARAGAPYPILRRRDGNVQLLQPRGGILGVLPEARYELQRQQLWPGDEILFYSDGLEAAVNRPRPPDATTFPRKTPVVSGLRPRPAQQAMSTGPAYESEPSTATALAEASTPLAQRRADNFELQTPPQDSRPVAESQFPPDQAILGSAWCELVRRSGLRAGLERLRIRYDSLRRIGKRLDDLTAVGVHIRA
jgi:hypothetical protein